MKVLIAQLHQCPPWFSLDSFSDSCL